MQTVTVSKETLQKLLDYIGPDEAKNFEECMGELSAEALENHAHVLVKKLQACIDANI